MVLTLIFALVPAAFADDDAVRIVEFPTDVRGAGRERDQEGDRENEGESPERFLHDENSNLCVFTKVKLF